MIRWISPPVAFVIAAVGMWLIGHHVDLGRFSFAYAAHVGIALIVLGLALVVLGLRSFVAVGTTPDPTRPRRATELVTTGIYALTRNPMYVGDAVMLTGIAVWTGNALNAALVAAFVWYIDRCQIAAEENALTGTFGDRYVAYRSRVRRWL
jgi:protein-S-isoprenylcysteine O-methyltransferase Ste14